jgi:hypothetical protein
MHYNFSSHFDCIGKIFLSEWGFADDSGEIIRAMRHLFIIQCGRKELSHRQESVPGRQ